MAKKKDLFIGNKFPDPLELHNVNSGIRTNGNPNIMIGPKAGFAKEPASKPIRILGGNKKVDARTPAETSYREGDELIEEAKEAE